MPQVQFTPKLEFLELFKRNNRSAKFLQTLELAPATVSLALSPKFCFDYDSTDASIRMLQQEHLFNLDSDIREMFPHHNRSLLFISNYVSRLLSKSGIKWGYIKYPPETVACVVILARLCGYINAQAVVKFWRQYYPLLVNLVPSMGACSIPSTKTMRRILTSFGKGRVERFFNRYFGAKLTQDGLTEQLLAMKSQGLTILAFDGQENRSGYVKGCPNRRKKGNHIVSLVIGGSLQVVASTNVSKKNNEAGAFIKLIALMPSLKGYMITCDALNFRNSVYNAIAEKEGDFGFKVKANSRIFKDIVAYLDENFIKPSPTNGSLVKMTGGKIATYDYEIHSVSPNDLEFLSAYPEVKTIVKVSIKRDKIIDGICVSSSDSISYMIFSTTNESDIKKALDQIWCCETMHYINDMVLGSDKFAISDTDYMACQNAGNKIAYNVINYHKQIKANSDINKSFVSYIEDNASCPLIAMHRLNRFLEECQKRRLPVYSKAVTLALDRLDIPISRHSQLALLQAKSM